MIQADSRRPPLGGNPPARPPSTEIMRDILSDPALLARGSIELLEATLAHYPGAVALIDERGAGIVIGGTEPIVEILRASGRWAEVAGAAARARAEGGAAVEMIACDGPDSPVEATLLPP